MSLLFFAFFNCYGIYFKLVTNLNKKGEIVLRDNKILKYLTYIGILCLPILFRKQPVKDWVLVYAIKAFYSGFVDSVLVANKKVYYPVRALPKIFNIHIIFDLLLFPIACVFYNQVTYRSNIKETIPKVFLFSIPITIIETVAEKHTNLIKYKNNWNWFCSFLTLTFTFWLVRGTMGVIRKLDTTTREEFKAE
jgi:hypothetical protein